MLNINNKYPAFNWSQAKNQSEETLFAKAFTYCTEVLQLRNDLFTGQMQYFQQYKPAMNLSGGLEWHNPTYSIVLNLAHSLTQDELDQHIILYHGVRNNQSYKSIFKSKLKPGPGQAYQGKPAKNPNMKVPHGVYGSQFLNVTWGYVDNKFPMVLQIATRKAVMTNDKNIFVIPEGIQSTPIKLVFPFQGVDRSNGFR